MKLKSCEDAGDPQFSFTPSAELRGDRLARLSPMAPAMQLEQHRAMLQWHARRQIGHRLRQRISASDVVQDTFLTAVASIHSYQGTTDLQMRAWLLQILRTRVIDAVRRHLLAAKRSCEAERAIEIESLSADAASPQAAAATDEQLQMIRDAIERLEPQLRQIIGLRHLCGASLESISSETGLSSATVWRRCNEAVDRLRLLLNQPENDSSTAAASHSAVSR